MLISRGRAIAGLLPLLRRFRVYLAPQRGRVLLSAALALAAPFIGALLLWLVKLLVDDVLVARHIERLPAFAALYVLVVAAKFALDYAVTWLEAAVAERIIQNLRTQLYAHLIRLSPGSLGHRSVGDLLAHLSTDAERSAGFVYTAPLRVFSDIIGIVFFGTFLVVLSWQLTLLSLMTAPLLVLVSRRYGRRLRRASTVAREQGTRWMALAEERLGATMLLQAFGTEAMETARFAARTAASRRAELRTVAIQAGMTLLIEATVFLGGLAVLAIGAYEIAQGGITLGTLVAFLGSIGSLYEPVRGLARATARFQRGAAGAQRIAALLDTRSLVAERPSLPPAAVAASAAIEFRDVRFAYPGQDEVLKGVSLTIAPGEMVALVGPSGSGKSTLMRLLLRLHDPSAGAVLLDGRDVRELPLTAVRQAISAVFQEPYLFRGSIAANIRYGRPEALTEEVLCAARAAHADGFATALPRGYSTTIGPRGAALSGGQRQRVALARALLRDAPILVLDEATAAIDSETEELIQDALERLAGRRTIVLIGHRLSSLKRADRIVVLDQGRVVEQGTPRHLLAQGGRYRDLFAAQMSLAGAGE